MLSYYFIYLLAQLDTSDFSQRSRIVHTSLLNGIKTRFKYLKEDSLFAYATFFDPTTKSLLPDEYFIEHEHNILNQVNSF